MSPKRHHTSQKISVCTFPKKESRKAENTFICTNKQGDFVMAFTLQIRQKKLFGKTVLDIPSLAHACGFKKNRILKLLCVYPDLLEFRRKRHRYCKRGGSSMGFPYRKMWNSAIYQRYAHLQKGSWLMG